MPKCSVPSPPGVGDFKVYFLLAPGVSEAGGRSGRALEVGAQPTAPSRPPGLLRVGVNLRGGSEIAFSTVQDLPWG